jgi:hypothetical protein
MFGHQDDLEVTVLLEYAAQVGFRLPKNLKLWVFSKVQRVRIIVGPTEEKCSSHQGTSTLQNNDTVIKSPSRHIVVLACVPAYGCKAPEAATHVTKHCYSKSCTQAMNHRSALLTSTGPVPKDAIVFLSFQNAKILHLRACFVLQ